MDPKEFEKRYMRRLNARQKEAVFAVDGPVLLLATPGSGKTTVLVTRLGYMVLCRGIDPKSILTMTYTVAETKELLEKAIPERFTEKVPSVLRWALTMVIVMFGWVLFDRTEPGALRTAMEGLFSLRATDWATIAQYHTDALPYLLTLPVSAVLALPVLKKPIARMNETAWGVAVLNVVCIALLVVCIASLISESFNPFIYFRF